MEINSKDYSHIKGWGIDADPENDPAYPMKKRTSEDHIGYNWERPAQQSLNKADLRSVERPNYSAVFGTSVPLSGLSGRIRRFAFNFSEGSFAHWIPLLLADRINVIEGIADDLKKGKFPNIFAEKGLKANWNFNQQEYVKRIVAGVFITTATLAYMYNRNKKLKLNNISLD